MARYKICITYRTKSGKGRVTYRPDYSYTTPWVSYHQGTAGRHFVTLESAQEYYNSIKDPLVIK